MMLLRTGLLLAALVGSFASGPAIGPALAAAATEAARDGVMAPDGRGASVAVIFNTAMPESRAVAAHYAERRGVPAQQVIGLELPVSETMTRAEYTAKLEGPLVSELKRLDLLKVRNEIRPATEDRPGRIVQVTTEGRVRNLVLCYGVPMRVAPDPTMSEPETAALPELLRRNEAAVDAELTALPLLLAGQPRTGPLMNPWLGITNAALLQPSNGVFVVGRLDGPTADVARLLVDRAMEAEQNGLWGRGYFDIRGLSEGTLIQGDHWISNAWAVVSGYGFDTHLDRQPGTLPAGFPLSQVAFYAGWYDGNVSGPFAQPQVEFMPGAIAYHLHSYSAASLRTTNQYWVGPLLARGATATMGMVSEPYLDGTPDIGLCLGRLLFFGFTWGEAAIASQRMLSWQLTVIGDPLYRPFRLNALERAKDLASRNPSRFDWALATLYNRKLEVTRDLAGVLKDLAAEPRVQFSSILQEKLGDFRRAAGQSAIAAESYGRALKLVVSSQQRKRLLWNHADALEAAGKTEDAYDAFRRYAKEVPQPSDPALLYERLQALAKALGKESDATRWGDEREKLRSAAAK